MRDIFPESKFVNSPDSEIERVIYTTKVVASRFYEKRGFVVVPELLQGIEPASQVILPRIDYRKVEDFFPKLEGIDRNFPMQIPDEMRRGVGEQLASMGAGRLCVRGYERRWKEVEGKFWEVLRKYFPDECRKIGSLEVRITRYGTVSSSNLMRPVGKTSLIVYLRRDTPISHVAEMIIAVMLRPMKKKKIFAFNEIEAIADFMMTRGELGEIFGEYNPTLGSIARVPARVRLKSARYVSSLGIEYEEDDFSLHGGRVYYRGRLIDRNLSKQEKIAMRELVIKRGSLVEFDEMASALWGEESYKTIWALNKVVQRLRGKLERSGIGGRRIETLRGRGYVLGERTVKN